jgi:hypothetical protein
MNMQKNSKQLSFPRVAAQKHPFAVGDKVTFDSSVQVPDAADLQIATEMLEICREVSVGKDATGEWNWINKNKRAGFIKALAEGNPESLALLMCNFFRNDASFGLVSGTYESLRSEEKRLELENNTLLDIDTWRELTDSIDIEGLRMLPDWGNPFGTLAEGCLIAPDTPRHDYFASRTLNLCAGKAPVVLEIGGGYGGMAAQVMRRSRQATYIDCDLPETLMIAYYFLRKSLGMPVRWAFAGVTPQDLVPGTILLVPANAVSGIECDITVAFNSNSLSEMAKATVDDYFAFLNKLLPKHFYHQNSNYLLFPDSVRHIEVLAREFPIDRSRYSEIYRAIAPWQTAGGRYREYLWTRAD